MIGIDEERTKMAHTSNGDLNLMVNATPSTYKLRFDIQHALNCFDTLSSKPEVLESVVKSILHDLLSYLSYFEDTNRLLIARCSRVEDSGYEAPFEFDLGDLGDSKRAESTGLTSLEPVK